jgi:exonuclease SbcC
VKLHRLELTGFGPFREHQTVDFDAFDDDGLFLISGRTGAGKSSILDGVSFALYGSVPRYEGGDRRLRSDHSFLTDPTEVRLEFTVGGARWRVTRAPEYERPAKRGGGLTLEPARAELEEWVGGGWVGRAAKQREVGLALDEVLGLSAQQFQQVILLAQNKFSRFLLAGNAERQQLLRTLFGTRRFEQYKDALEQRRRDAQRRLDERGARVRTLLEVAERDIETHRLDAEHERAETDDIAARVAAVDRAVDRARYRVEAQGHERDAAVARADAAAAALQRVTEIAQRLGDLDAVRRDLARLDGDAEAIAAVRARLDAARSAEVLRISVETAGRAIDLHASAAAHLEEAARDWRVAGGDPDGDLDAISETLTAEIARARAAAEAEADAASLARAQEDRRSQLAELTAAIAAVEAARAGIPARRAELTAALETARDLAARREDRAAARDTLTAQRDAARTHARLSADAAAADERYAAASTDSGAASRAVADLLRRRLRGHAAELAADLVDGQPCVVCGATTHPAPAAPANQPVTDADLAEAEAARDEAARREREAAEAATAARAALAAATAAAGGRTIDEVTALAADAEARLADAEQAQVRATELAGELAELERIDVTSRDESDALTDRIARLREEIAGAEATLAGLRTEIDAARGDHETVRARIAADTERRALAQRVVAARRDAADRARARDEAVVDRDARVAASVFGSVDEILAALLTDPERATLATRIDEHAAAVTAARARAFDLELATVDEHVDDAAIDAATRAAAEADAARAAAIGAAADAVSAAASLSGLAAQIQAAADAVTTEAEDAATVTRLADTVAGRAPNTRKMDLETFVLAAELEEIVAAANLRLSEMSSGRYTLHHSDARQARGAASGLAIEVLDAHTGRLRSPQSLSGGETFLASLALALGLAEVVTSRAGGIRLDTLFIDEGFGSLDPETLELAMRTLDELRAGGRVVGVISHVEAMKEQIPAQLAVEATPEGPSVVRQGAAIPT